MRTAPLIFSRWNAGGPFIGDDGAPHGRVTVEEGWLLTASGATVGSYHKGPVRWFQRKDNSQVETEVPNIKTIQIDRSLDTDAAQCTIVIQNQKMLVNGVAPVDPTELGQPGYYTFNRGESATSLSRWGHVVNDWNRVLVPNALLRTYQGYGGRSKALATAITDGNIIQSGLWLIDSVNPQTNGDLVLTCRDVGKLLVDQSLYPPLVPKPQYPLFYYRWINQNHPPIAYGTTVYGAGYTGVPAGTTSTAAPTLQFHVASSSEPGHAGGSACDFGDSTTFWLSGGNATAADWEFIEFEPAGGGTADMSAFDMIPWGGGYDMYVSVSIAGVWQGTSTIPAPAGPTAIKYVMRTSTQGWEQPFLKGIKGGPYIAADRIRFTFSTLTHSSIGPPYYRAGIRDLTVGTTTSTMTGGGRVINAISSDKTADSDGYYLFGSDGGVFSFGDAIYWGSEAGKILAAPLTGGAARADNTGYWLVASDGGVFAFHGAHFYGSLPSDSITPAAPIIDIERSEGGAGYYLIGADGGVFAYGDATYAGAGSFLTNCVGGASHPSAGYWLVDSDGHIDAFGGAGYHGGASGSAPPGSITGMCATSTGNGYWIVGGDGAVYAFGDALYHGGANTLPVPLNDPISGIEGYFDDTGYWLVGQDGGVFAYPQGGPRYFWGSLPQSFDIETAGNYTDWVDIVKDLLLWAGFWLYDATLTSVDAPEVFGNIESTGAFAQDNLTEDFFDKKQVIDVLHTIREVVGYLIYVDDQGGYHFHPPNIFAIGNFLENGVATDVVPEIDEKVIITNYQVAYGDKDAVTSITISSSDPTFALNDTVITTRPSPTGVALLKGIVKNALWINGAFTSKEEQNILAELIDLYLFLAQRQGAVQIYGNPAINLNDQVRIFERQTSETYIHYVSGISSTMDLVTGQYDMTLTTHWLGDGTAWFLTYVD